MAINVTSFTSTLRKQSLLTLLQNMDINFLEIKNRILLYCNSNGDTYETLLNMFYSKSIQMTSSELNANILLFYLDFYSNYISLYSLYENYKGLVDISKGKYLYIDSIIKELNFLIDMKEKVKLNKYVNSIDFTNTSQISLYKSDIASRSGSILPTLNTDPILSLPINTFKELSPYNIITIGNNSTEKYQEVIEKYTNDIYYNIIRTDNDYVCTVNSITDSNKNISKSLSLKLSGVITDLDISSIYLKVSTVTDSSIKVRCSSSNEEWSDEITIESGVSNELLIEENINTGLYFTIIYDTTIKENDTWIINLKKIQLPYPETKFKIMFNGFDDISLIKLNDISNWKLYLNYINSKRKKSNLTNIDYAIKNNRIIAFPNEAISELNLTLEQRDSSLYNYNGKIGYNYTYYLSDIKAIINEYIQHGNKSFNKISVEDINNVKVVSDEYIYKKSGNSLEKMFIEYNLYTETEFDKLMIPTLTTTAASGSGYISEYIIPSDINESNTALYKTRFPVDTSGIFYLLNLSDDTTEQIFEEGIDQSLSYTIGDYSFCNLLIRDFDSSKHFAIKYKPKIYNSNDTYSLTNMSNWIKNSKLYYMYFKDINNCIRLAIKVIDDSDSIIPFTGEISSFIEMRSLEEIHLSPYILGYSIICN